MRTPAHPSRPRAQQGTVRGRTGGAAQGRAAPTQHPPCSPRPGPRRGPASPPRRSPPPQPPPGRWASRPAGSAPRPRPTGPGAQRGRPCWRTGASPHSDPTQRSASCPVEGQVAGRSGRLLGPLPPCPSVHRPQFFPNTKDREADSSQGDASLRKAGTLPQSPGAQRLPVATSCRTSGAGPTGSGPAPSHSWSTPVSAGTPGPDPCPLCLQGQDRLWVLPYA